MIIIVATVVVGLGGTMQCDIFLSLLGGTVAAYSAFYCNYIVFIRIVRRIVLFE
jgi:hypothetical protein